MRQLKSILVAFAAISLVGLTGCPEDDPSDDDGNGDQMDAAMDTEQPDMGEPDMEEADMGQDTMADTEEDTPPMTGDPIPDIHDGTISTGSTADLDHVLVTAVNEGDVSGENGFAVQEPSSNCTAADGGCGIWVETGGGFSNYPSRGDNISFEGTVEENFGLLEIVSPTNVTVNSSGNSLPQPVVVDPAVVWTDGSDNARRDALRGTLVRVENVTTVNTNPDDHPTDSSACNTDHNEWAVWSQGDAANAPEVSIGGGDCSSTMITTGLRVDDWFFSSSTDPSPDSEIDYDSITGPFVFSFGNSKIVPRDSADIVEASQ